MRAFTAKEAREFAKYGEYFAAIRQAAINGKDCISIHEEIEAKVFTDLGYKVGYTSSQKDGPTYTISW